MPVVSRSVADTNTWAASRSGTSVRTHSPQPSQQGWTTAPVGRTTHTSSIVSPALITRTKRTLMASFPLATTSSLFSWRTQDSTVRKQQLHVKFHKPYRNISTQHPIGQLRFAVNGLEHMAQRRIAQITPSIHAESGHQMRRMSTAHCANKQLDRVTVMVFSRQHPVAPPGHA
jgi:hypothetical protein